MKRNIRKSLTSAALALTVALTGFAMTSGFALQRGAMITDVHSEAVTEADGAYAENEADYSSVRTVEPEKECTVNGGSLKVFMADKDEYGSGRLAVEYNGSTFIAADFCTDVTGSYVLARPDGGFYLLLQRCDSNDWRETLLLEYTDVNGMRELDRVDGGIPSEDCFSEDGVVITGRLNALGTYGTEMKYSIKCGALASESSFLMFSCYYNNNIPKRELVTKAPVQADSRSGSVQIPAGSKIYPMGYDLIEENFYFEYNGTVCTFRYNREAYPREVNGINEADLFERLPYAG